MPLTTCVPLTASARLRPVSAVHHATARIRRRTHGHSVIIPSGAAAGCLSAPPRRVPLRRRPAPGARRARRRAAAEWHNVRPAPAAGGPRRHHAATHAAGAAGRRAEAWVSTRHAPGLRSSRGSRAEQTPRPACVCAPGSSTCNCARAELRAGRHVRPAWQHAAEPVSASRGPASGPVARCTRSLRGARRALRVWPLTRRAGARQAARGRARRASCRAMRSRSACTSWCCSRRTRRRTATRSAWPPRAAPAAAACRRRCAGLRRSWTRSCWSRRRAPLTLPRPAPRRARRRRAARPAPPRAAASTQLQRLRAPSALLLPPRQGGAARSLRAGEPAIELSAAAAAAALSCGRCGAGVPPARAAHVGRPAAAAVHRPAARAGRRRAGDPTRPGPRRGRASLPVLRRTDAVPVMKRWRCLRDCRPAPLAPLHRGRLALERRVCAR